MNDPILNDAPIGKRVRRRRSWYRRRLRMRRTLVAVVVGTAIAGACWQNAARYFSLPSWHASQVLPGSFWMRGNVRKNLGWMAAQSSKAAKYHGRITGVYPYSVIPGGVKDPNDLHYAALRDYVVRRHYARFDFSNARLMRATQAREVYLSYRIRDTVFWTRRKIRLQLGELLLTDGKITARARCGNQISDTAKPEVSSEEPDEDILDQPVAALEPDRRFPSGPCSARPTCPSGNRVHPSFSPGGFFFPYVPVSVPLPFGRCAAGDDNVNGRCRPKHHKPPTIPEPSTMLLAASGLALMLWRYRRTARPVAE